MIVRLKGVKRVRSKGRVYYYHRKTMTRLPVPGAPGFSAKLEELNRQTVELSGKPGAFGALVGSYRASPEFAALASSTIAKYQKIFDALAGFDRMPLAAIDRDFLYGLRDKMAAARKRAWTNLMLALLKSLFNWGMKRGHVKANPAASVEKIRRPRSAPVVNRPWRREELDVVLDAAPAWLRVPIAIAAYTGLRESDVLRATWACYDGSAFEARSLKTNTPMWVPTHTRLRALLDAAPRLDERIVLGARGRPIGQSTLTTSFFGLLKRLREEGRVGSGLSFHGLRHTLGTALAEAGCDPPTIAAVLGQASTGMAEHYSRHANRRHLAATAMAKLENKMENQPGSH